MSDEFHIPWSTPNDSFDEIWSADSHFADRRVPDMLATMYAQQKKHMQVYDPDSYWTNLGIQSPTAQAKLREFAAYSMEEWYEAINHLKNKPWKKTFVEADKDAFLEEMADMFHFFLEFLIIAKISPEQLFRAYFAKTLINIDRQGNDY